jgi:hypothetical protein
MNTYYAAERGDERAAVGQFCMKSCLKASLIDKARGVKEVMIPGLFRVKGFSGCWCYEAKEGCFFGERDILQFHHSRRKNQ